MRVGNITNRFLFMVVVAALLTLLVSTATAQTIIQKEEGDDEGYISALPSSQIDNSGTTPGPGSPTGKSKPPRVGTNRRVNDPQQGFPNGLFGRYETTSTGTTDGQFLVFGWNDAQGFCGPPLACHALHRCFLVSPDLATRPTAE